MKKLSMLLMILLALVACGGPVATTEPATPANTSSNTTTEELADDEQSAAEDAMGETPAETESSAVDEEMVEMADAPTDIPAAESEVAEELVSEESETIPTADLPAWQALPLVNARTGESFTLADFAGKTVFVEPMATWCTNCRQQMFNIQAARPSLNDDVVFIGLSVETNISDADLATYADGFGFDWLFAVMTPEMLQALNNTFGRTIANPPSTPHFIINPDNTHTELITGTESPDEIISSVSGQ